MEKEKLEKSIKALNDLIKDRKIEGSDSDLEGLVREGLSQDIVDAWKNKQKNVKTGPVDKFDIQEAVETIRKYAKIVQDKLPNSEINLENEVAKLFESAEKLDLIKLKSPMFRRVEDKSIPEESKKLDKEELHKLGKEFSDKFEAQRIEDEKSLKKSFEFLKGMVKEDPELLNSMKECEGYLIDEEVEPTKDEIELFENVIDQQVQSASENLSVKDLARKLSDLAGKPTMDELKPAIRYLKDLSEKVAGLNINLSEDISKNNDYDTFLYLAKSLNELVLSKKITENDFEGMVLCGFPQRSVDIWNTTYKFENKRKSYATPSFRKNQADLVVKEESVSDSETIELGSSEKAKTILDEFKETPLEKIGCKKIPESGYWVPAPQDIRKRFSDLCEGIENVQTLVNATPAKSTKILSTLQMFLDQLIKFVEENSDYNWGDCVLKYGKWLSEYEQGLSPTAVEHAKFTGKCCEMKCHCRHKCIQKCTDCGSPERDMITPKNNFGFNRDNLLKSVVKLEPQNELERLCLLYEEMMKSSLKSEFVYIVALRKMFDVVNQNQRLLSTKSISDIESYLTWTNLLITKKQLSDDILKTFNQHKSNGCFIPGHFRDCDSENNVLALIKSIIDSLEKSIKDKELKAALSVEKQKEVQKQFSLGETIEFQNQIKDMVYRMKDLKTSYDVFYSGEYFDRIKSIFDLAIERTPIATIEIKMLAELLQTCEDWHKNSSVFPNEYYSEWFKQRIEWLEDQKFLNAIALQRMLSDNDFLLDGLKKKHKQISKNTCKEGPQAKTVMFEEIKTQCNCDENSECSNCPPQATKDECVMEITDEDNPISVSPTDVKSFNKTKGRSAHYKGDRYYQYMGQKKKVEVLPPNKPGDLIPAPVVGGWLTGQERKDQVQSAKNKFVIKQIEADELEEEKLEKVVPNKVKFELDENGLEKRSYYKFVRSVNAFGDVSDKPKNPVVARNIEEIAKEQRETSPLWKSLEGVSKSTSLTEDLKEAAKTLQKYSKILEDGKPFDAKNLKEATDYLETYAKTKDDSEKPLTPFQQSQVDIDNKFGSSKGVVKKINPFKYVEMVEEDNFTATPVDVKETDGPFRRKLPNKIEPNVVEKQEKKSKLNELIRSISQATKKGSVMSTTPKQMFDLSLWQKTKVYFRDLKNKASTLFKSPEITEEEVDRAIRLMEKQIAEIKKSKNDSPELFEQAFDCLLPRKDRKYYIETEKDRVIDAVQHESDMKRPIPDKKLSVVKRS